MDVPANPKLWQMLATQAKAKFPKYPSLPASKWIHQEYVKKGGQFVSEATATRMANGNDSAAARKADADKKAAKKKEKGGK